MALRWALECEFTYSPSKKLPCRAVLIEDSRSGSRNIELLSVVFRGSYKKARHRASIPIGLGSSPYGSLPESMRCLKAVTPTKIDANRKNAKRSTGPRTERGKSIARFNAVTLGLFAKHVVIPICDGYKPEKEFQSLLDGLHQEFQPLGLYEEWLVVKIAECMWRLRRATRCESGSVREASAREASIWNRCDNDQLIQKFASELCVLDEAERQLRESGTLSQKTCREVTPLLQEQKRKKLQSEQDGEPIEAEIDCEFFLTCVTDRKELVESLYESLTNIEGKRSDARFDHSSLLAIADPSRGAV
jgi:hypothetical protein